MKSNGVYQRVKTAYQTVQTPLFFVIVVLTPKIVPWHCSHSCFIPVSCCIICKN